MHSRQGSPMEESVILVCQGLRLGMAADEVPDEWNKLLCHLCVQFLVLLPLMTPKAKKPDIVPTRLQMELWAAICKYNYSV